MTLCHSARASSTAHAQVKHPSSGPTCRGSGRATSSKTTRSFTPGIMSLRYPRKRRRRSPSWDWTMIASTTLLSPSHIHLHVSLSQNQHAVAPRSLCNARNAIDDRERHAHCPATATPGASQVPSCSLWTSRKKKRSLFDAQRRARPRMAQNAGGHLRDRSPGRGLMWENGPDCSRNKHVIGRSYFFCSTHPHLQAFSGLGHIA